MAMLLEDYFEFEKFDTKFGPAERIRLKGHRVSIENIVEPFLRGLSPDVIAREYCPSLTLEQIYATITYYLRNQGQIDEYLRRGEVIADAFYKENLEKGPYALRDEARGQTIPPNGPVEPAHG
jgi:uncharacterized protein (DUF433 family)